MMICNLSHLAKVQCLVFAETKVALPGFRVAVVVVEVVRRVGGVAKNSRFIQKTSRTALFGTP